LYIKQVKFKIQTPFHFNNEKIDILFDRLKKNNVNKVFTLLASKDSIRLGVT